MARSGLAHKGGMIAAVLAAACMDGAMYVLVEGLPSIRLPFDYPAVATPLVLCWYLLTELGSVIENAAGLGAPIPPFLKKALAALSHTLNETVSKQ
ncbi:prophage LambdaSa04, holin [gut metagenome]|uniref:Prophage LambdaSa04, holin n=1 Tax=gut metagenome TaxID=749906 RepID=J9FY66_9ZZZZ